MVNTLKELNDAMDRAFEQCRDVPYDLPYREDEIRTRYIHYVSRLESLLVHFVRRPDDVEFAVKRLCEKVG